VRLTLDGFVTDAILSDAYGAVARYMSSHGPCRAIVDTTNVTKFDVSSGFIRTLAKTAPAVPAGYMRVFVAPPDSTYGMVRMFQILTDLTRPDLHIVRSLDEAYRLLEVEAPGFSPIS
jgi:hypothetical protein